MVTRTQRVVLQEDPGLQALFDGSSPEELLLLVLSFLSPLDLLAVAAADTRLHRLAGAHPVGCVLATVRGHVRKMTQPS